jgi:hypothetical protein
MSNKNNLSIFAYLPNGIIREIVAYTGATFKRRNGKYIGQISKNDPRYALLYKIPPKIIVSQQITPLYTNFASTVLLFKNDRFDIYTIKLQVSGLIWGKNKNTIVTTRLMVDDGNSPVRYYEYDEDDVIEQTERAITFWQRMFICGSLYLATAYLAYTIGKDVRSLNQT